MAGKETQRKAWNRSFAFEVSLSEGYFTPNFVLRFVPGDIYHSDYGSDLDEPIPKGRWRARGRGGGYSDSEQDFRSVKPRLSRSRKKRDEEPRRSSPPGPPRWESPQRIAQLEAELRDFTRRTRTRSGAVTAREREAARVRFAEGSKTDDVVDVKRMKPLPTCDKIQATQKVDAEEIHVIQSNTWSSTTSSSSQSGWKKVIQPNEEDLSLTFPRRRAKESQKVVKAPEIDEKVVEFPAASARKTWTWKDQWRKFEEQSSNEAGRSQGTFRAAETKKMQTSFKQSWHSSSSSRSFGASSVQTQQMLPESVNQVRKITSSSDHGRASVDEPAEFAVIAVAAGHKDDHGGDVKQETAQTCRAIEEHFGVPNEGRMTMPLSSDESATLTGQPPLEEGLKSSLYVEDGRDQKRKRHVSVKEKGSREL